MIIQDPATMLVIAGAWNPAILTPAWLLKEAFGAPEGQEEPVGMEFALGAVIVPRFSLRGMLFTATPERLTIGAGTTSAEALNRCEEVGRRILAKLPHTPVTAFGENFKFIETAPASANLEAFVQGAEFANALANFDYTLGSQTLVSALLIQGSELNLSRSSRDGQVIFDFNFHYTVRGAADAEERINATFARNFEIAKRIWTQLMGQIEEAEAIDNA